MGPKSLFNAIEDISLPPIDLTTSFAICTSLLALIFLLYVAKKRIHWFLRPSLLIFAVYVLRIELPSILYLKKAADTLQTPWHFGMIIHGFSLIFLIVALPIYLRGSQHTEATWKSMRRQIEAKQTLPRYCIAILLTLTGATMIIYFMTVPFTGTGLYYLFTDPMSLNRARDESLKLLSNPIVRYLYSWNFNTFVPLLLVAFTTIIIQRRRLDYIPVALAVIVSTLMTMSRASVARTVLIVLLTFFFIRTKQIRFTRLTMFAIIGVTLILLGPALISILREGKDVSQEALVKRLTGSVLGRAELVPSQSIMIYVYHTQITEQLGLSGIRPLAALTGQDYFNMANETGRIYVRGGGATTLCNANFIGAYYASFGLWTIPFCVIGVLAFDVFVLVYRIPNLIILPIFILLIIKAIALSQSVFTTLLLTNGFILIPVLALLARQPKQDSYICVEEKPQLHRSD